MDFSLLPPNFYRIFFQQISSSEFLQIEVVILLKAAE